MEERFSHFQGGSAFDAKNLLFFRIRWLRNSNAVGHRNLIRRPVAVFVAKVIVAKVIVAKVIKLMAKVMIDQD